ncbi:ABC transporter ATP-binding protein [Arthrobacter sp. I2-34]|uniref:ABC transporter ATP-binding protein n=1 Tax=Arthrobacter hankyongi TaxID=2904801 RepID=A0ABS9L3E8_9MICC|nr:ABC transporter ATP-binding protein [Arthrobacter hankyongi]MCG2621222.1 ABC transporter ATP-binding protein [Arthrobacter hankyongi]
MTAQHPLLEVSSIAGGYGDITVVRDVSFTASAGRITAILGRNGAGKTTSLRMVSGLNPISAGSIRLGGKDVGRLAPHARTAKGIAYVQEGKRIFRQRSVQENLMLGSYPLRIPRSQVMKKVEEAFDRFPALAKKRDVAAGLLSGGQQQMLAIAQALAPGPKVLMLDEPTTGLAPAIVGELFDLITRLRDEGLAVVLVEQAVDFCLSIADEAVVLNLGQVVYRGDAKSASTRGAVEATYMGVELA